MPCPGGGQVFEELLVRHPQGILSLLCLLPLSLQSLVIVLPLQLLLCVGGGTPARAAPSTDPATSAGSAPWPTTPLTAVVVVATPSISPAATIAPTTPRPPWSVGVANPAAGARRPVVSNSADITVPLALL